VSLVKDKQSSATRRKQVVIAPTVTGAPANPAQVVTVVASPQARLKNPRRLSFADLVGGKGTRSYAAAKRASDKSARKLRQRTATECIKISDLLGR